MARQRRRIMSAAGVVGLAAGLLVPVAASSGVAAASSPAAGGLSRLSRAQAQALGSNENQSVIVVMKNQVTNLPATKSLTKARDAAVDAIQRPVLHELAEVGAKKVHSVSLIDAVTATVSRAEEARLAADPNVARVYPDATTHLNFTAPGSSAPLATGTRTGTAASATTVPACQPGPSGVELDPEALSAIRANNDLPGAAPTAASLGIDGSGVTVAFMAEGIDTSNPDFVRSDGQKVFTDYQDFTGEGTATPDGSGGEASLDSSSIAAQGRVVYNFSADGTPCKVRILGAAPGANLVALKVFPDNYDATSTALLLGINYAVTVDHVNVLSQSFGYNPLPDTMNDLIRMADEAAFKAGTVVTVSTGDAGPTSTEGSPSTDPAVIAAGASTTYRVYADFGVTTTGWENDNPSALSSGGFTEGLKGPDLLAPGDLNLIDDNPSPGQYGVTDSGGTSEAAPLTAAVAALVIQAYAKTHGGATPTPTLVKEIITSTATNLGLPGDIQGSGLLNAYAAVKAAESVKTSAGAPAATGDTFLTNQDYLTATAQPGTKVKKSFTVTNTGAGTQTITAQSMSMSAPATILSESFSGSGSYQQGYTFRVKPGVSELNVSAIVKTTPAKLGDVNIVVFDPLGQLAMYGLPQGSNGTSNGIVRYPAAGKWTVYVVYSGAGTATVPGALTVSTQSWAPYGSVSPASLTLAPGASKTVQATLPVSSTPGDQSAQIALSNAFGVRSSIPVALRSLVPLHNGNGSFSTPVVGGNGRGGAPSTVHYFAFDVPKGAKALNVAATYKNGSQADLYSLYLIDPAGEALGHGSNQIVTTTNATSTSTKSVGGAVAQVTDPAAGQWTAIIEFANPTVGVAPSAMLSGKISLTGTPVSVTGMPATVTVGKATTVRVKVKNTTAYPQAYFLDPRVARMVTTNLRSTDVTGQVPLPLAANAQIPQWVVPTDTTSVSGQVSATAPVTFDMSPYLGNDGGELNGDPQTGAVSQGDTASATWSDSVVTPGVWDVDPGLVGMWSSSTGSTATSVLSLQAVTAGFNRAMATSTGDWWADPLGTVTPVVILPGQTVTLSLKLNASAASRVKGQIYVDTLAEIAPFGNPVLVGNQVAGVPYSYTAKKG